MNDEKITNARKRRKSPVNAGSSGERRRAARGAEGVRKKKPRVEFVFAKKDGAGEKRRLVEFVSAGGRRKQPEPPRTRLEQRRVERLRRQKRACLALLLLVMALLCLCGWQYGEYKDFRTMRAAVEVDTFYEGTCVENYDVSQMTLEQALAYWQKNIEPAYSQRAVKLSDGTVVTAEMVGYHSNYADVLEAAYAAGRSGGLRERYETLGSVGNGVDYVVTRSSCTEEGIGAFVESYARSVDCEPVTPTMSHFDTEKYVFVYEGGANGKTLNREALRDDLLAAFSGGGDSVTLDITETPFTTPTDEYGIISMCVTNASSSSSARIHNIRLAMRTINGTCLQPGETFSFNGVVGQRTKSAGYREAKAYYGMQDILEVGGGICQVSSTVYAAARSAGLEIVERHEHSRKVYYIKTGWDATVDWGHLDLKFSNNRDEPVYLCCVVTEKRRVCVGVFGKLRQGDYGLEHPSETAVAALEEVLSAVE